MTSARIDKKPATGGIALSGDEMICETVDEKTLESVAMYRAEVLPPKGRKVEVGNKDGLDINVMVDVAENELVAVAVAPDTIERGTIIFFFF